QSGMIMRRWKRIRQDSSRGWFAFLCLLALISIYVQPPVFPAIRQQRETGNVTVPSVSLYHRTESWDKPNHETLRHRNNTHYNIQPKLQAHHIASAYNNLPLPHRSQTTPPNDLVITKPSPLSNEVSISAPTEVLWVEAGANGNGSRSNPAGDITYLLTNKVSANDVIHVKPGTYNTTIGETFPLNLTHHSNITLTSTEGASVTIINDTGTTTGIQVTASNITINGFTIKNCGDKWDEAAVYLHGANDTTIKNNTITDNEEGIYLEDSSGNTIVDNTLTNNTGKGIYLEDSSG
ncbi:MAG: DUF1565 domain-containing protein, partial [Candidatus Korarchaeota archaeon]|nr:DUF1565 domain-containing protein [Candidatus Korarchaeota archaeon]